MVFVLLCAATAIVVVCGVMNLKVMQIVYRMEGSSTRIDVVEGGQDVLASSAEYRDMARWAEEHGFEPHMLTDYFGLMGRNRVSVAIWQNQLRKTLLLTYPLPFGDTYELVTPLNDEHAVITSSNVNALSFPWPPTLFQQAFPHLDLDGLLKKHQDAVTFLCEQHGFRVEERPDLTQERLCNGMKKRAAYIKTIPLWQLRGAYWFFIRKRLLSGRSVAEQMGDRGCES